MSSPTDRSTAIEHGHMYEFERLKARITNSLSVGTRALNHLRRPG